MQPAQDLIAAFEALRAGDHPRCRALAAALDTPALRQDRPGLVGRALAFAAQSALAQADPDAAQKLALEAIRLAKRADPDALPDLRDLHARAAAQSAALQAAASQRQQDLALAATPLADILAAPDPVDRLLRLANALADLADADGSPDHRARAQEAAALARDRATDTRGKVLSSLLLARLAPPDQREAAVLAAWRIADLADDQNLIAFSAQTARLLRVEIPTPEF